MNNSEGDGFVWGQVGTTAPWGEDETGHAGQLFTVPAWRPFADDLAAGLLRQFPDQMQLAKVLLLLPSRRAIRAVTEAFLRESEGKALLLPRMAPAGDLDLEDVNAFEGGPLFDALSGESELHPVILPQARRLALARILATGDRLAAAEAVALGAQLANALDTLEIEGKTAADLEAAVPTAELQAHWSRNAEVLRVVVEHWPHLLNSRGLMDASRRRNLQLRGLAARWQEQPPVFPVVMAGFSAAPPAVADLARVVVSMEQGQLVLPGLDLGLPEAAWDLLADSEEKAGLETHAQYGMSRLLQDAGVRPQAVRIWPYQSERPGCPPARTEMVAKALLPPELSAEMVRDTSLPAEAIQGLRMIEAANPAEEALVIALAMRQILEHPGKTAALVTPDRTLASRVAVQLKRFGINVEDSAGIPLRASQPGSLLVSMAQAAGEAFAPVALIGLLQHPLIMAGPQRMEWLNRTRQLDKLALRKIRPAAGLKGVAERLRTARRVPDDLKDWWADTVMPALAPLEPLPKTAAGLLDALRTVAETLSPGEFWAEEAGRVLGRLFKALEGCREDLEKLPVTAEDAASFVSALMAGETVRPHATQHPQLQVWGPLEARLQTADLLLMGGLNEGTWPGFPTPDPFLAPAIRRHLALPGLARRTGMQAHDFAAGLGAGEVLLTRSVREGGAPTVASRFWQRLLAVTGEAPDSGELSPPRADLLGVARQLDVPPEPVRYERPAPAPDADLRPRQISVTEVSMLKADPFAFYAKRMLGLSPLDPRDAEPTAGERGQVVHKIVERVRAEDVRDPVRINAIISEELQNLGDRPEIAALWRPRVERMVDWVIKESDKDKSWTTLFWEKSAELDCRGVILKGRVDRVDGGPDGLKVIDYKSGSVPPPKDVAGLYQTQLALLAHMTEQGLFGPVSNRVSTHLEYWKLSGGTKPGEVKPALGKKASEADLRAHIGEAFDDFMDLIGGYLLGDQPFVAKQSMVYGRKFKDYDHLARVAEWLGR